MAMAAGIRFECQDAAPSAPTGGASAGNGGAPERVIASLTRRLAARLLSAVAQARRIAVCAGGIGLGLLAGGAAPALAGHEVVLRLKGGDIEVAGEVRSFDGQRWVVAARGFGELALEAARFDCVEGDCSAASLPPRATLELAPASQLPAPVLTLDTAPPLDRELIPSLIRAYAGHMGGSAKQMIGAATDETRFKLIDRRGLDLAEINVRRRGSDQVFAALRGGEAAIGATTRTLTPAELAQAGAPAQRTAFTDNEHVLGLDGLAVIVPPGSPARRLAAGQLARIFSGEISDWKAVGLPPGPITVYAGGERTADALAAIARPGGLALSPAATRIADEAALSDAVARDAGAIGITSLTQVRNARAIDIELACGLVARPTDFAIKAEEYPLGRRLYVYSNGKPREPMAQELIRFAASRPGQQAVRDGGLIDQAIAADAAENEKERLTRAATIGRNAATLALGRRFAADVEKAHRLSLTFRFALNSSELDAKARGDIQRLAELLKAPELKGRTAMLIGFTDAPGKPQFNAALSQKRADEIRSAVLKELANPEAARRIVARGYGPAAPVACNGGDAGQFRNRRVEVWIRDGGEDALAPPVATLKPARPSTAEAERLRKSAAAGRTAQGERKRQLR